MPGVRGGQEGAQAGSGSPSPGWFAQQSPQKKREQGKAEHGDLAQMSGLQVPEQVWRKSEEQPAEQGGAAATGQFAGEPVHAQRVERGGEQHGYVVGADRRDQTPQQGG